MFLYAIFMRSQKLKDNKILGLFYQIFCIITGIVKITKLDYVGINAKQFFQKFSKNWVQLRSFSAKTGKTDEEN